MLMVTMMTMNGNHHQRHNNEDDDHEVEEDSDLMTIQTISDHPILLQQLEAFKKVFQDNDWLVLLRGPILIGLACLSITVSILSSLSITALFHLLVLGLGLALLTYDTATIGENQLRFALYQFLNTIVWDDVLYQFWHPNIDWFRVYFVDNFIGLSASWMYLLPSRPHQRIQLVQAALGVSAQEAQRILFQPGGYLQLVFPPVLLQWLQQEQPPKDDERQPPLEADVVGVTASSNSSSESSSSPQPSASTAPSPPKESLCHPEEESSFVLVKSKRNDRKNDDAMVATRSTKKKESNCDDERRRQRQQQQQRTPLATTTTAPPPLLSETMKSIIMDTLRDQLREVLSPLANNTKYLHQYLAGIGITTTTALVLQLRYSPRARNIALGFLETTIMAGLSALGIGAMTSLFVITNQWLLLGGGGDGSSSINENNLISYISNVFKLRKSLSSSSTSTGATPRNSGNNNNNSNSLYKKKGFLCTVAVVLTLVGLQRRRRRRR